MKARNKKREQVEKLVLMALLTALVAVLSYLGGFIRITPEVSINLTLVPIVLGAALLNPLASAWLGGVSGFIICTGNLQAYLQYSVHGTYITVMAKGILAGLIAGLVYYFLKKVNRYVAVIVSAIVCPIVNTGIYLIGLRIFFWDTIIVPTASGSGMTAIGYLFVGVAGLNFILELIANIILAPTLYRLTELRKKI